MTIDRAKFDAARAAYAKANEAFRAVCATLEMKYGGTTSFNYSAADRNRLDRLRRADDRASDRLFRLLDESPRRWRGGVPAQWVCAKLTYEDAIRPKDEPLSVVPPCSFGTTEPIK